jgi:hypothetical protein
MHAMHDMMLRGDCSERSHQQDAALQFQLMQMKSAVHLATDAVAWGASAVHHAINAVAWGSSAAHPAINAVAWGASAVHPAIDAVAWGASAVHLAMLKTLTHYSNKITFLLASKS